MTFEDVEKLEDLDEVINKVTNEINQLEKYPYDNNKILEEFVGTHSQYEAKKEELKLQKKEWEKNVRLQQNQLENLIIEWIDTSVNRDNFFSEKQMEAITIYCWDVYHSNGYYEYQIYLENICELIRHIIEMKEVDK